MVHGACAGKQKERGQVQLCLGNAKACLMASGKKDDDIKECRQKSRKSAKMVVCVTSEGMKCEKPGKCNPRENVPLPACGKTQVRCRDQTCVERGNSSSAREACAGRSASATCSGDLPVLCPDGLNCAENLRECAKFAGPTMSMCVSL